MRKQVAILVGFFVGIFMLLTLLDHSEYQVEKKLWRAKKQFEGIARDPKVVPEKKFEEVIGQYQDIIQQYPRSTLLPRIYTQIGHIYVLKGDYAKARTVFEEMMQRFSKDQERCAEALFNIGNTFELEVDFNNALRAYNAVWQRYPDTEFGLDMPLYIANYYMQSGKAQEAKQSFVEATAYYIQVVEKYPHSRQSYRALRSLTTCYVAQQDWPAAVDNLARMLLEFSTPEYLRPQSLDVLIKSINTICVSQLKDYEQPQKIYQSFMERYPHHPLNPILKEALAKLAQARAKEKVAGSNP